MVILIFLLANLFILPRVLLLLLFLIITTTAIIIFIIFPLVNLTIIKTITKHIPLSVFISFRFFFGVFDLHLFSSIDCDRIVIIISQRPWQLVESCPWLLCRSKCLTICRQQHHDSSKLPDVIPKSGVQVPVGICWRTYMRTF